MKIELSEHLAATAAGACLRAALADLPDVIRIFSAAILIVGEPASVRARTEHLIDSIGEMIALASTTPAEKEQLRKSQDFLRVYLAITLARGGWTLSDQIVLAE